MKINNMPQAIQINIPNGDPAISMRTEESVKSQPPEVDSPAGQIIIEEEQKVEEVLPAEYFFDLMVKSILDNAAKIPHDTKFPYLDKFANKTKDRDFKNISEIIKESNEEITKASNQNLIFSAGSTTIGATANLTNYGLVASGGVALPWLAGISILPAVVNFVHKVKNGVDLNAYLEGRGYLLKYLENVAIMLICDVAKRIESLPDTSEISKENAEDILKNVLQNLQEFNLAHYDPEPFYYKWSAQAFRQGLSNALSGARIGVGIASFAGSIIALPVGIALTGTLLSSEVIGGCLYKKSHNLRNEKATEAAQKLDLVFEDIFKIYRDYLQIKTTEQMQNLELKTSPDEGKEELRKFYEYLGPQSKKIHEHHHHEKSGEHNSNHNEHEHPHHEKSGEHNSNHNEHEHHHHEKSGEHNSNHNEHEHPHHEKSGEHNSNHNEHEHPHHEKSGEHDSNHNKHEHPNHKNCKDHKHSHNWQNRYFNKNCEHNLGEEISTDKVKFTNLASVNILKEDELTLLPPDPQTKTAETKKILALPLPTHVHCPELTKLKAVQKISNCYNYLAKNGAKLIEKSTGCIGKSFGCFTR